MSYYLFLDDLRNPEKVTHTKIPDVIWTIARNYDEFVNIIQGRGLPKYISFDHDLGEEHYEMLVECVENNNRSFPYHNCKEKTGYDCAKWLAEYCIMAGQPIPEYGCHSMNPIGKKNIIEYLESYKKSLDIFSRLDRSSKPLPFVLNRISR